MSKYSLFHRLTNARSNGYLSGYEIISVTLMKIHIQKAIDISINIIKSCVNEDTQNKAEKSLLFNKEKNLKHI